MKVTSHFLGNEAAPVDNTMSVISFMYGPIMTHLAEIGAPDGIEPEVILLDHLPQDLESLDDDEFSQVFEEACVMVLNVSPYEHVAFRTVDRVQVESVDIPELKRIFGINKDLQIGIQLPSPETVSSIAHPGGKVTMPLMVDAFA